MLFPKQLFCPTAMQLTYGELKQKLRFSKFKAPNIHIPTVAMRK